MNRPPKGDEYRRGNYAGMMFQPSANDNPDMTIRIKQGSFWINNERFVEYEGGISPKIVAPASGAKWVVVALNKTGKVVIVNGLPRANNPEPPTLSQNMLPLAFVYVKSSTTVITNDMVYDARPNFAVGGYPVNHGDLKNRNKENAHDIESITGLRDELNEKITVDDAKDLIRNKADYNGTVSASFTLNIDDSGVPVEHCGLYVNRGSQPKVGIKYNEDIDEWQYTNDGANWNSWGDNLNVPHASATEFGVVKLSVDPVDEPVVVGVNDPKYLSIDEKVSRNDLRDVYITRDEVLNRLEDKMDVEGTYSKDDINSIFVTKSSLDNTMLDTYTRGQIDSFLQVKANVSQVISKAGLEEALSGYYTKEELDAIFNDIGLDEIREFDIRNYYVKSEVDTLLQNVVTSTYTRIALDAMLENKANAVDVHNELDLKANADNVYTKEQIDNRFDQEAANNTNAFYKKEDVDLLLASKALLVHNHASGDIIEDAAHRFVSDNQIDTWNNKQDALGYVAESLEYKGLANGYAPLDANAQVPIEYLPDEVKRDDSTRVLDTYNDLITIPDMSLREGARFVVLDATGDPSGITGKAEYIYHNGEFVCTSINPSVGVDWDDISNKPDFSNYCDKNDVYIKEEVYNRDEINSALSGKADSEAVYSKQEIDDLFGNIPSVNAYTREETDAIIANVANAKADVNSVYTISQVDDLVSGKADVAGVYTKYEIDMALSNKANATLVYTKEEVDNLLYLKANASEVQEISSTVNSLANNVYTKAEVDSLIQGGGTAVDAYTKSEVNSLLAEKVDSSDFADEVSKIDNKADADSVYTKEEVDDIVANITPASMQEFVSGDCRFVAYESDAITFSKNGNSISITKNKPVKSVRFSVSTDEIGSNNRILIDYDAESEETDMLTYDYANVQYMQLMGSRGATKVGTNIFYTNENNPHYCECALSFDNQGPVVVKITY